MTAISEIPPESIFLSPHELRPSPHNARTHSKRQIRQIADSIRTFGFVGHVLVDAEHGIIAGHGRVEAAKLLKLKQIPVLCIAHLSPAEVRAYMMADNRLAELAGWDENILAIEFSELLAEDLTFDISVTGFDIPQIDVLLAGHGEEDEDTEPPLEIAEDCPPVTRSGDIWNLGKHRLYCGDALQAESYERLLGKAKARMVFTDSPYNVPVNGHVSGLGKHKHQEFAMASGEMTEEQFTDFLQQVFRHLVAYTHDGSIHYCCMDWRHVKEMTAAADEYYAELKNICVWNKNNGGMGSLYRSKHELVFVYKNGKGAHVNNVELGKHGRYRSNVWDYPGQNSIKSRHDGLQKQHPTPKPVAMVKDAILDCSRRNDLILDPFGGSGTTLIAAEKVGRKARLIEFEAMYCDMTIHRWQALSGEQAIHAESGETFDELQKKRGGEDE